MRRPRCTDTLAGLGRRRVVPSFRCRSFSACRPPSPRKVRWLHTPSSSSAGIAFVQWRIRTRHSRVLPLESASCGPVIFGVSRFTDSLRPADLLASLADLTGHLLPSQQRLLPPSFRTSRSPSSPSDISTVASGRLHRQDFHLLERQLASLHRHTHIWTAPERKTVCGVR